MTVHGHLASVHEYTDAQRDTVTAIAEHVALHDDSPGSNHWHSFGTVSVEDRDYRSEDDVAVWAIENAGSWYLVEDFDAGTLLEEVQADQCEDCGSFDKDGEPGRGFVWVGNRNLAMTYECGECGSRRYAVRKRGGEVIW